MLISIPLGASYQHCVEGEFAKYASQKQMLEKLQINKVLRHISNTIVFELLRYKEDVHITNHIGTGLFTSLEVFKEIIFLNTGMFLGKFPELLRLTADTADNLAFSNHQSPTRRFIDDDGIDIIPAQMLTVFVCLSTIKDTLYIGFSYRI